MITGFIVGFAIGTWRGPKIWEFVKAESAKLWKEIRE